MADKNSQATENLEKQLAQFLEQNPSSSVGNLSFNVKTEDADESEHFFQIISAPWSDNTLGIVIDETNEELIEVLNNVVLPERLSAIYHPKSRKLEVIWTAYKLAASQDELVGREFNLCRGGMTHKCVFEASSKELLILAGAAVPLTNPGETNFRNLLSYRTYVSHKDNDAVSTGDPYSFWIENVDWDETETLKLISLLNFYLTYFDKLSPTVLIHEPKIEADSIPLAPRYIAEEFPTEIQATELDRDLVQFWTSARMERGMMKFLLLFRILEYAADEYVDVRTKSDLKRIIASPNVSQNYDSAVADIVVRLNQSKSKGHDVIHFKQFVKASISPKKLWLGITENKNIFTDEIKFAGGFTLPSFITASDNFETFENSGVDRFADQVRKVRNALSHGRDTTSRGIISPTTGNLRLLEPWVQLIEIAAGEVVLFKHIT